jgi:hypothetical protein
VETSSALARTADSNDFMNSSCPRDGRGATPCRGAIPALPECFRWRCGPGACQSKRGADGEELHPGVVYCAGRAGKYAVLLIFVTQLDTIWFRGATLVWGETFTQTRTRDMVRPNFVPTEDSCSKTIFQEL